MGIRKPQSLQIHKWDQPQSSSSSQRLVKAAVEGDTVFCSIERFQAECLAPTLVVPSRQAIRSVSLNPQGATLPDPTFHKLETDSVTSKIAKPPSVDNMHVGALYTAISRKCICGRQMEVSKFATAPQVAGLWCMLCHLLLGGKHRCR